MNKLMKLGATALFALFLAACDKPDPAADFKKLADFNKKQQESHIVFEAELQKKLATKDAKVIEAALNEFSAKLQADTKELEAIEVKSDEMKAFKEKMKETFVLSNELVLDSVKMLQAPTEELQKALTQKVQNAQVKDQEFKKQQAELQQKYAPAK